MIILIVNAVSFFIVFDLRSMLCHSRQLFLCFVLPARVGSLIQYFPHFLEVQSAHRLQYLARLTSTLYQRHLHRPFQLLSPRSLVR